MMIALQLILYFILFTLSIVLVTKNGPVDPPQMELTFWKQNANITKTIYCYFLHC